MISHALLTINKHLKLSDQIDSLTQIKSLKHACTHICVDKNTYTSWQCKYIKDLPFRKKGCPVGFFSARCVASAASPSSIMPVFATPSKKVAEGFLKKIKKEVKFLKD